LRDRFGTWIRPDQRRTVLRWCDWADAVLASPGPAVLVHGDLHGNNQVWDPAEVQAAIRDVFAAFTACGSAYGVVAAFAGRRFPLRAYGGAWAGQLRWGKLTHARVLGILKNPGYAGAYVFGRYTSRRTVDPGGTVHTSITERPTRPIVTRI
jgi:hypothetical protein